MVMIMIADHSCYIIGLLFLPEPNFNRMRDLRKHGHDSKFKVCFEHSLVEELAKYLHGGTNISLVC